MNTLKQLSELESKLDTVLFREKMPDDYYDTYPVVNEKYRSDLRKKRAGALATAAVGAGAYYGGKKAASALVDRYSDARVSGAANHMTNIARGVASDASGAASALKQKAANVPSLLKTAKNRMKSSWRGTAGGKKNIIQRGIQAAGKGLRVFRNSANIANRIVELDDKLDQIIELRSKRDGWVVSDHLIAPSYVKRKNYDDMGDDEFGYHPDKARRTMKGVAGASLIGAGLTGAVIDRLAQKHNLYRKAGDVYKTAGRRVGKAVAKLRGK